jgi:hypothetical protein
MGWSQSALTIKALAERLLLLGKFLTVMSFGIFSEFFVAENRNYNRPQFRYKCKQMKAQEKPFAIENQK